MLKRSYMAIVLLASLVFACNTTGDDNTQETKYYKFTRGDGSVNNFFVAKTSDADVIAKVENELDKPMDQRSLFIIGDIERGSDSYNNGWSWHFISNEWNLAETSVEVCDGTPQMVEENLDYWINKVGYFCPWSYAISREVDPDQI